MTRNRISETSFRNVAAPRLSPAALERLQDQAKTRRALYLRDCFAGLASGLASALRARRRPSAAAPDRAGAIGW